MYENVSLFTGDTMELDTLYIYEETVFEKPARS